MTFAPVIGFSTTDSSVMTTEQHIHFHKMLQAMWPSWREDTRANKEEATCLLEIREAFIRGIRSVRNR